MNENDWRKDPRLAAMDPQKVTCLTDFAKRISGLPKNQILPAFLSMQQEARRLGIEFSDEETGLLVSVMTSGMSAGEKKRMEMLRTLAKNMAARSS
ncbi:MAG: hypothetical protein PHV18_14245 [Lachnospiraceae bacterium]|nr:hypothetical protein [Lachnospiraceae bacterium]